MSTEQYEALNNTETFEVNDLQTVQAAYSTLEEDSRFATSVTGPIVAKLRERGDVWEPEPLVELLDARLRKFAKQAKGNVAYDAVHRRYGECMINAVVQGAEAPVHVLSLWGERVERDVASQNVPKGARQRADRKERLTERKDRAERRRAAARKRLEGLHLVKRSTANEESDTDNSPAVPKQPTKGKKGRKQERREQKTVKKSATPSAKAVFKSNGKTAKSKHKSRALYSSNSRNSDRGYKLRANPR